MFLVSAQPDKVYVMRSLSLLLVLGVSLCFLTLMMTGWWRVQTGVEQFQRHVTYSDNFFQ